MKKINKLATNTAIALCAIVGIILVGAIAYSMIQNNEPETEEITPPAYTPSDNISFSVKKYHLEDHNLSIKLLMDQDETGKLGTRCYVMVSELYKGTWTNLSIKMSRINETDDEIILENITTVPDGYHKIFCYIVWEEENKYMETRGISESFTIESVLGHERSWQVVDEWP